jgi:hypothetical protein
MLANNWTRIVTACFLSIMAWIALTPKPEIQSTRLGPGETLQVDTRITAKAVVARELLAGRLSLAEATAVFAWLVRQPPTAVEGTAQEVFDWAMSSSRGANNADAVSSFAALEDRSAGGAPLLTVNETDCQELMARAAAAVFADRGCPVDHVTIADLRLVRSRN